MVGPGFQPRAEEDVMAKKGKGKKSGFAFCVLGGCAKMAVPALKAFAEEPDVERVLLADRDAEGAHELARAYGAKFSAAELDATDGKAVAELVEGFDAALGYIGPFYHFEAPIAQACIDAGTPYLSIADDFDAYLAVEKLHEAAKAAGVVVITGLGNSPGITNLLAKKGYLSMDAPERINVHWTGGSDEEVGPANVRHVMHIFEGETLQWIDGREAYVKTGRGAKTVEFPAPIGVHTVYYTGHAESVSLPRNLKGLKEVTLHGGIQPNWVALLARTFGDLGLTTTHKRREIVARLLAPAMNVFTLGGAADKSVFRIDVYGTHKGRPRHHFYTGVGPIAEITSFPLVEGALAVARGEIGKPGVFAAEAAIDPDSFLPRLAKRGVKLMYYEGVGEG
ncbi:MAG: saccharopine dehydrogenase [Myxococcales bacterium]|nr:MAG: saccharopine dehydrogenase [Myxococcales bacterium]